MSSSAILTRDEALDAAAKLLRQSTPADAQVAFAAALVAYARELRESSGVIPQTAPRTAPAPSSPRPSASDGPVFPPYGRSKGQPVSGASAGDLEFYANGCKRTLNDAAKSRWHDKERELLAAIEAEIARQGGGTQQPPSKGDWGSPPPGFDEPPPHTDEDIPF